jgi:hypothetical protein
MSCPDGIIFATDLKAKTVIPPISAVDPCAPLLRSELTRRSLERPGGRAYATTIACGLPQRQKVWLEASPDRAASEERPVLDHAGERIIGDSRRAGSALASMPLFFLAMSQQSAHGFGQSVLAHQGTWIDMRYAHCRLSDSSFCRIFTRHYAARIMGIWDSRPSSRNDRIDLTISHHSAL